MILPKTWHSVIALSEEAVFYESITGPYEEKTHKKPAGFAPAEDDTENADQYLQKLVESVFTLYIPPHHR